jgi:serine/threonine-protein kinase
MTSDRPIRGRSRYRVERTLGRGGMATVYLARDTLLDRDVAVKVLAEHLAEDELFRARFLREARLAARIAHANVVRIYDVAPEEHGLSIVMEYVDGESLAVELRRRGRLPAAKVTELGLQLCAALQAAHTAGLVHRDVKPQNVLLRRDGTVKLGDFGIARSNDSTALTEHGSVLGTAAYLAPEQARGETATPATDLFALGVVLYEALTGQRPHAATSLPELLYLREHEPVQPPGEIVEGVPPALDRAIMHCLAVSPADRPVSAKALAVQLGGGGMQPTETTLVAATRPLPSDEDGPGLPRAFVAVLGVLALCGLGLATWAARESSTFGSDARQTATVRAAAASPVTTTPPPTRASRASTTPAPTFQPPAAQPSCDKLDELEDDLEDQQDDLHESQKGKKNKSRQAELRERRRELHEQKQALREQAKACR